MFLVILGSVNLQYQILTKALTKTKNYSSIPLMMQKSYHPFLLVLKLDHGPVGCPCVRTERWQGLKISHCPRTVIHLLLGNGESSRLSVLFSFLENPMKHSNCLRFLRRKRGWKWESQTSFAFSKYFCSHLNKSFLYNFSQFFSWFPKPGEVSISMLCV